MSQRCRSSEQVSSSECRQEQRQRKPAAHEAASSSGGTTSRAAGVLDVGGEQRHSQGPWVRSSLQQPGASSQRSRKPRLPRREPTVSKEVCRSPSDSSDSPKWQAPVDKQSLSEGTRRTKGRSPVWLVGSSHGSPSRECTAVHGTQEGGENRGLNARGHRGGTLNNPAKNQERRGRKVRLGQHRERLWQPPGEAALPWCS